MRNSGENLSKVSREEETIAAEWEVFYHDIAECRVESLVAVAYDFLVPDDGIDF